MSRVSISIWRGREVVKHFPVRCCLVPGLLLVVVLTFGSRVVSGQEIEFDRAEIFDQIWEKVQVDFWDESLNGVDWEAEKQTYRPQAIGAETHDQFADVINQMLATLKTSHTHYYPTTDPRFHQIIGIFDFIVPDDDDPRLFYDGIGISTKIVDDRTFVDAVYDGLPASLAGLRYGDEIVSVDGAAFHPISSFAGKAGEMASVEIRRVGPDSATGLVNVEVKRLNARTMFETALEESVQVMEVEGKSIGYLHVWSYAGRKYHEAASNQILWGKLAECDALVFDIRDGWGGASLEYINLFREPVVEMRSQRRDEKAANFSGVWGKPVVLLVNDGSRSGKELYAFAFKKLKLGEVVGQTTAGAVVAGSCSFTSNGDILYLAVSDVEVDGVRLEGHGVQPTIAVERPLPYANGKDPQKDRAIGVLMERLKEKE